MLLEAKILYIEAKDLLIEQSWLLTFLLVLVLEGLSI
jgi:hypothetical protein